MRRKLMFFFGVFVLLLGMGLNLKHAWNDYGLNSNLVNSVMAQTTGETNPGDQPVNQWSSMYVNCYDKTGNRTGRRLTCYQPGYKSSCTPHGCQ